MRPSIPQAVLVILVACLLGGLVWGVSTSGAAFDPYNYDWDGGSDLRTTVDDDATLTIATTTTAYNEVDAAGTVAIVQEPRDRYDVAARTQLASFMAQGGTLVITTASTESNELLADLDSTIRVNGTTVRDEGTHFRDPALPEATGVSSDPLVRDVDAITLNHGTVIDDNESRHLVNTSATAYLDRQSTQEPDPGDPMGAMPVVATEEHGAGQLVVVSDSSVFTNAMLDRDGNRQFLRNLAADHETVLLDYSQHDAFPPVTYALLTVRESTTLQFVLGLVGIAILAGWGRTGVTRLPARRAQSQSAAPTVSAEAIATALRERHPGWDDARIERVTKAIIRQGGQERDND